VTAILIYIYIKMFRKIYPLALVVVCSQQCFGVKVEAVPVPVTITTRVKQHVNQSMVQYFSSVCRIVPIWSACEGTTIESADVIIIGGGVVGLAVARELSEVYKVKVTVLEKENALAGGVSSGNSGIGCTGYDAPVGSLERKLLRRSINIHQNLYRLMGLSHDHISKCGAIIVAWNADELKELNTVIAENIEAGDEDVAMLSREELLQLEPGLSRDALGGVLVSREAVVEPWLIPMAYARRAQLHGARIVLGQRVVGAQFDAGSRRWRVTAEACADAAVGRSLPGEVLVQHTNNDRNIVSTPGQACEPPGSCTSTFTGSVVINCAGLYGDDVEAFHLAGAADTDQVRCWCWYWYWWKPPGSLINNFFPVFCLFFLLSSLISCGLLIRQMESTSHFKILPRKGQFVVYAPIEDTDASAETLQHIIQPVPTEFTKGVIVWKTVYGNIVVGPTAVDVDSKENRDTDAQTIDTLKRFGERVYPALRSARVVGTYSGLRPATQYRDYQIHASPLHRWITVGGIRSTGLTASSGIAEYVGELFGEMMGCRKAEAIRS
jgi:L-2-hydroxyglutarate oxidase LhgO